MAAGGLGYFFFRSVFSISYDARATMGFTQRMVTSKNAYRRITSCDSETVAHGPLPCGNRTATGLVSASMNQWAAATELFKGGVSLNATRDSVVSCAGET